MVDRVQIGAGAPQPSMPGSGGPTNTFDPAAERQKLQQQWQAELADLQRKAQAGGGQNAGVYREAIKKKAAEYKTRLAALEQQTKTENVRQTNYTLGNTQTSGAGQRYVSGAVRTADGRYRLPDGRVMDAQQYQQLRANPQLAESLGSAMEQQQEKMRLENRVGSQQSMLDAAANGSAPSAAQGLYQQLTDQGAQQQLSLARSGVGNPSLAFREAAGNAALIQQGAANQVTQLRASEQATARGQAAQYNVQQQQLNDQRAGQQQSESLQRDVQQMVGNMSYDQQQEAIRQWQAAFEQAKTQAERAFWGNLIGAALGAVGTVASSAVGK